MSDGLKSAGSAGYWLNDFLSADKGRPASKLGVDKIPITFKRQVADMSTVENTETPVEPLRLDHFLKTMGMSETGGQAKLKIQNGEVKVNGEVETRRRRKLVQTDVVEVNGQKFVVTIK